MLINFIRVVAIINALFLIAGQGPWHTGTSGTFDTALMALTVPFFFNGLWIIGLLPIGVAIGMQGEGTAYAVLAAQLLGALPWAVALLLSTPAIIYFPWKHLLQDHMLRIKMWTTYLGHWWEVAPMFIGFGHDTFRFRGPHFEIEGKRFAWAHNDWLEFLFDYGFVGLSFALAVYFFLLYRSRSDTKIFSALLGFGVCMFFYSPLRVITGQIIFATIILEFYMMARRSS